MNLKTYLEELTAEEKRQFRKSARVSASYLWLLKEGKRNAKIGLLRRLVDASVLVSSDTENKTTKILILCDSSADGLAIKTNKC